MPAHDTIAARVAEMPAGLPEEFATVFAAEQAQLDATGRPDGVLAPGAEMPDGELLDVDGQPTSLRQQRGDGVTVVVFYRGAWCPYCNIALKAYQNVLVPALTDRGVGLIAISPQRPDGSLGMRDKHALSYVVLSDPGNQIAAKLGILTAPEAAVVETQGALGLDLAEVNADGTRILPMPAAAIVDADGVLRWIDVHPNYATRSEPADILAALSAIGVDA
ncbi:MAG TPA: peroxiredoxin-like family protein [Pseudonocardiaceae bacterium]|nr:peroxiredoxin-like family protein [Pseudonocardiaceae bacterium]